jgi:PAS domain S-box-containing protein
MCPARTPETLLPEAAMLLGPPVEPMPAGERFVRAILDQAGNGVVVCDLRGQITFVNAAARRLAGRDTTGMSLEAALRSWGEVFYADGRPVPVDESSLLPILGGETRLEQEVYVVAADGRRVDLCASAQPLCDARGQVLGAVVTLGDITQRKQTEMELGKHRQNLEELVQQRTAELRQSAALMEAERRRFRDVLDQLPAYLMLVSPDHRVSFANRFFEERFGKSSGRRCYECLFRRNAQCENCESFKVLKTGAPHRWYWAGPDGRHYDIYDFLFTDADGSPLVMEVGLDITDRKAAEDELEKHRQHLEELVAERAGQLLAANAQLQAEVAERRRAEEQIQRHLDELRVRHEELVRFNRAMVDRELRMIELKQQVNELCGRLGQPPRYAIALEQERP